MYETDPTCDDLDSLSRVCENLRQPLEVIHSFADLLENGVSGALSDGQHDQVLIIKDAAEQLSRMIHALTGLAELEAGRAELHCSSLDLDELCRELYARFEPSFSGRGLRLRLVQDGALEARVEADRERLWTCLTQLLENGLKFTPAGGEVTLEVFAGAASAGVIVHDTGPGIPGTDLERVFDRYVRLESPAEHRGAGVGLTLCRAAVEAMGGRVWAESEERGGTRFHVEFPAVLAAGPVAE